MLDTTVYLQTDITFAQGNLYLAYRHSTDYATLGHIDVSYSTNDGATYTHVENVGKVSKDASWPTVVGTHFGAWNRPTAVIVAYEYNASAGNRNILYSWSDDYGATWIGGDDSMHRIAATASDEWMPKLSVDGMGTEGDVGGNFHLVYKIGTKLYYTRLLYWDIPDYYGGPYVYRLGWSSPHGLITDTNANATSVYPEPTITTYTRTVGGVSLWEPGVAWTDKRNPSYDIYYTTPVTDFSITFTPSSQSVVAGRSISYYVTVNLLGGTTAPAYLGGTVHYPVQLLVRHPVVLRLLVIFVASATQLPKPTHY